MMKKSVYRKVIFIMLCVALLLLIAIAQKVQVFQILMAVPFFPVIKSVLNNSWFCSICCISIINHVKNRLPNLRKKYPEIEEIFTRYEKNQNEEDLIKPGNILPTYFMDLKFMAVYWKALFDYLGYDPTFIKLFVDTYNSKYPIEQDMKFPIEVRNTQAIEVEKLVRKAMRGNQWKNFWMK